MTDHPTVLVIDDEIQIRRLLRTVLESGQYQIYEAENGQLGLSEAAHRRPDAIILDLGLPDMDGIAVLKRLREWSQIPVLVLSVRQGVSDKVSALDQGADDFITKPFHSDELLARLRVILRRSPLEPESPVFQAGTLTVDWTERKVKVNSKEVHLTPTEYSLLKVLIQHAGKVVTHRQLLREIWGPSAEEQAQYLRVYMNHLRKKIERDASDPQYVKTEPGIGYRFMYRE